MELKAIMEALLFAAGDEGLSLKQLVMTMEIDEKKVLALISELQTECSTSNRGITLIEIAGVYQFVTKKECATYLQKLVEMPNASSLSQATLETLSIVAYKQPITRGEIEEIRGVKAEKPIHTLVAKALIKEVGRAEGQGRAILYGTTARFLDYFGLKTIKELPILAELSMEDEEKETDLFFENFDEDNRR